MGNAMIFIIIITVPAHLRAYTQTLLSQRRCPVLLSGFIESEGPVGMPSSLNV